MMQRTPENQRQLDRAHRAVAVFNRMLPQLSAYARALTGDPKVRVVASPSSAYTDGETIFYRPPITLGDDLKHDRATCDRRDTGTLLQRCRACAAREEILVSVYHEVSHIAYGSFEAARITDRDRIRYLDHALQLSGKRYAQQLQAKLDEVPSGGRRPQLSFPILAQMVSPFLNPIVNGLEDVRIDEAMFQARRGTRKMYEASIRDTMQQGVEGSDGDRMPYSAMPLNHQIVVGLFLKGSGFDIEGQFHDSVTEALADSEIEGILKAVTVARDAEETFSLSIKALLRFRELGFCKSNNDPPEPEPEPKQDEAQDQEQSDGPDNQSADEQTLDDEEDSEPDDTDSDDSEEGDDDSTEGSGNRDDQEESDDSDGGDGDEEEDSQGSEGESESGSGDAGSDDASASDGGSSGSDDSQTEGDVEQAEPTEPSSPESDAGTGDSGAPQQGGLTDDTGDDDTADDDPETDDNGPLTDDDDTAGTQAQPVDSGAYRDDGAIESDSPVMGGSDGLDEVIEALTGHRGTDAQHDHSDMSGEEEKAIKVAVIQGEYFEKAPQNIAGVHINRVDDYRGRGETAWWGFDEMGMVDKYNSGSREHIGIDCDMDVPESVLGPALLETRRAFDDNRRGLHERNLRSGRINGKALAKRAPFRDERMFKKKTLPGKKSYSVLIGIDVSGSTVGVNIALAKRAAKAQAELCKRVGIDFAVYAHSAGHMDDGLGNREFSLEIYEIKGFDEPWSDKQKTALDKLGSFKENLDGHTMQVYRKMLEQRPASDHILLYYTDGKMPAANAAEELVVLQDEIRYCFQHQITLLGVGIRTDSPTRHGLDTVQVNDDSDLVKVVRHLERRLVRR